MYFSNIENMQLSVPKLEILLSKIKIIWFIFKFLKPFDFGKFIIIP